MSTPLLLAQSDQVEHEELGDESQEHSEASVDDDSGVEQKPTWMKQLGEKFSNIENCYATIEQSIHIFSESALSKLEFALDKISLSIF